MVLPNNLAAALAKGVVPSDEPYRIRILRRSAQLAESLSPVIESRGHREHVLVSHDVFLCSTLHICLVSAIQVNLLGRYDATTHPGAPLLLTDWPPLSNDDRVYTALWHIGAPDVRALLILDSQDIPRPDIQRIMGLSLAKATLRKRIDRAKEAFERSWSLLEQPRCKCPSVLCHCLEHPLQIASHFTRRDLARAVYWLQVNV